MDDTTNKDWQTDLASVADLSSYFRIERAAIPSLMQEMGVPRRGRGFPWIRIWIALGIDISAVQCPAGLKEPLLELKEVAAVLGESAKTTRRRSNGKHRDRSLPGYIDVGPRKRLFVEREIMAWISGVPSPVQRRKSNLDFLAKLPVRHARRDGAEQGDTVARRPGPSVAELFMPPKPGPTD